jgi:hypothetical protein
MAQQGQVFPLAGESRDGTRWAYRYRVGGRGSKRVQRGGFATEQAAAGALERKLEQLRREQGLVESPTLAEFVEVYLAQHEGDRKRPRSCAGCFGRRCARSERSG